MAKKEKEQTVVERISEMTSKGWSQTMPGTGRTIRLRTVDCVELLREGKVPEILTPLVVKSVYQELSDNDTRRFIEQSREKIEDAIALADSINFICERAITDGTKVKDLTIAERRWIFRLVLGPAELLVTFRIEQEYDVETVAEGEDLQSTTE
jgi:hypothetical protein